MIRQRATTQRWGAMGSGSLLLLAICAFTWSSITLYRHYVHGQGPQFSRPALASRRQPVNLGFTAVPASARGDTLVVTSIRADGPADRAGLAIGDVIEQIDGRPADALLDPARQLRGNGGHPIDLRLVRDGAVRHLVLENGAE